MCPACVTILVRGLLYLLCFSLSLGAVDTHLPGYIPSDYSFEQFLGICMLLRHQYGVCGHIGCRINSYCGCLAMHFMPSYPFHNFGV